MIARILFATGIGYALIGIDASAVVVVLHRLGTDLNADLDAMHWIVSIPHLAIAGLTLPMGALADKIGPRKVFVAGLVLLGISYLVCALSTSVEMLSVGRIGQGIGDAAVVASALAYFAVAYGDKPGRPMAVAWWTAIGAIIAGFSSGMAGVLAIASWRWVFGICIPIVILCLILVIGLPHVESPNTPRRQSFGWQATGVIAIVGLVGFLIEADQNVEPHALVLGVIGLIFGVVSVWQLRRDRNAHDVRHLLRTPGYRTGFSVVALTNMMIYALPVTLALYLSGSLGWNALTVGYALLPLGLTSALVRFGCGPLMNRIGIKAMMVVGCMLAAGSFALLAVVHGRPPYDPWILVVVIGCGLAASVMVPSSAACLVQSTPDDMQGRGNGISGAGREAAVAVGIAVFSLFVDFANSPGPAFLQVGIAGALLSLIVGVYALRANSTAGFHATGLAASGQPVEA